jgi:putative protease
LAPGDGLCFGNEGFLLNGVEGRRLEPNRRVEISPGTPLYRNYDRLFNQQVERSRMRRTLWVEAEVEFSEEAITLRYRDGEGVEAEKRLEGPFEAAENPERMAEVVRTQVGKSGDTIFRVERVMLKGRAPFLRASLLAELRRETLALLLQQRLERKREHRILPEQPGARYPHKRLTACENLTNSLAEAFYRDHGVEQLEQGLDLAPTTRGACVMQSPYCIRREIGECLREGSRLREELYLEHGRHRYRLHFDCAACEMSLIDETK